ncbi:Thrombospondin type 3 repeat-containing protein [Salinimicrobium catena]|uniref:Thrombospondin type 3 repeat-containing protein n=1 Tax=Salinimicrobium catena TaxID=390640 RepID=A0A1H5LIY0_9FLAO|nr:thrombospondin type 3 repeat-containing protein [Salinimicrobium catena]SDL10115.1 Thrombospondin type 3 repeat-containing protein [Salinimicrobium catena]SEE76477.1 Thrombospondin type 3 repeat-containing protein [Salinimicrobium catena]
MKKFNFYLSFLAVFALLFTSCSKDEDSGVNPDSEKATLSFGAIVQDLANKSSNKQSEIGDMPECTDDTAAYVEIVLMQGEDEVVGTTTEPFRVDLVAGQLFTEEVPELELTPGTYSLDHFAVYNEEGTLIWLAPKGGVLAQFVDNPLPLNINLGAGVKKYVDVSVICYDDRDVNQYGYMFFELDMNEAFEYCFFANYCTPEGRHFPARYSVDISIDGNTIYSGVENTTGTNEDGDLFAEPLCFALPNIETYGDEEEYIDYTITLLDWDAEGAYGDVEQMVITGSLSRAEIMANFDGEEAVEYEHLRFGCDDGQVPEDSDNDGVIDSEDDCPNEAGPASNNGCPVEDQDSDNDGVVDSIDECPDTEAGVEVDEVGCPVEEGDEDNDGVVDSIDECPGTESGVEVDEVGCPIEDDDEDNDGVVDSVDQCPNTPEGTEVDEVGCPIQIADCIPAPVTGCETSEATTLTVEDGFVISQEFYGDITVQVDEATGNLTVGVTPVAPYELTDLQVYVESEALIQCYSTTEPESGVTGTVEGDFGDAAFDVEVTVNYCDVSN